MDEEPLQLGQGVVPGHGASPQPGPPELLGASEEEERKPGQVWIDSLTDRQTDR